VYNSPKWSWFKKKTIFCFSSYRPLQINPPYIIVGNRSVHSHSPSNGDNSKTNLPPTPLTRLHTVQLALLPLHWEFLVLGLSGSTPPQTSDHLQHVWDLVLHVHLLHLLHPLLDLGFLYYLGKDSDQQQGHGHHHGIEQNIGDLPLLYHQITSTCLT